MEDAGEIIAGLAQAFEAPFGMASSPYHASRKLSWISRAVAMLREAGAV